VRNLGTSWNPKMGKNNGTTVIMEHSKTHIGTFFMENNVNHHHTRVLQSPGQIILPKVITSCQGNVNVFIYAPK